MDKLRIYGGRPLLGSVSIGGAKNAALPLMAASILTEGEIVLENVPDLGDVVTFCRLLRRLGVKVAQEEGGILKLCALKIEDVTAPYDLVRKMRASILVLGPLLARVGKAYVSLPGGCAIGTRPIDLHLQGLRQMGATIDLVGGYVHASVSGRLMGTKIIFPTPSVGATENLLMAGCLAKSETVLINASHEPEVEDLTRCLVSMGAQIEGIGTDHVCVYGEGRLKGVRHKIIGDRIEAGTYAMAVGMTGGNLEILGVHVKFLQGVIDLLRIGGLYIEEREEGIRVSYGSAEKVSGLDVMTEPFPGFPTDLQAQVMALMTLSRGAAMITETIFENRFMHVPELLRMGANITVHRASALVRGVKSLRGAPVMATDLRASVSLVLAGLAAEGVTEISRIYHLDRGYEALERKLVSCGAQVERITD